MPDLSDLGGSDYCTKTNGEKQEKISMITRKTFINEERLAPATQAASP